MDRRILSAKVKKKNQRKNWGLEKRYDNVGKKSELSSLKEKLQSHVQNTHFPERIGSTKGQCHIKFGEET